MSPLQFIGVITSKRSLGFSPPQRSVASQITRLSRATKNTSSIYHRIPKVNNGGARAREKGLERKRERESFTRE